MNLDPHFIAVVSLLTAILGVGRLTRALVYDDFPPSVWVRIQWGRITKDGPWSKLVNCWWCASFWIALICVGWWIGAQHVEWVAWAWWVFWGALAVSYVATMVIVRDTPTDGE